VDKVSDTLIFRYNEDQSISSLDPAFIKSQAEIWIAAQIYNGLVDLDSALKPIPMLAKSWEISENGLVYKFHLKKGVRFFIQNPEVNLQDRWVTAADVAYSFGRLVDKATASPGAWVFSDKISQKAGEKPFYAENDSTFILTMSKPFPAILALLATSYCYIVPKELVEKDPVAFGRNPSGTGPFFVKYWEEDVKMVLLKNPVYFEKENGKQLPYLQAVNVDFIKNKQTAFMRFVAGEYDFFNGIEGSFKDELLSPKATLKPKYRNKFKLLVRPFLNTEYLGFYLDTLKKGKKNVLQNLHLRKALSFSINREQIVKYFRNGAGEPGVFGFVPPILQKDGKVPGYNFNIEKAKEELKLAGFPGGKDCPVFNLTTTADYLDLAVLIKKGWANIGITVNIDVQTGGMLRQMRNKGELQIYRGSWIADYASAENYMTCFYSKNFSPNGPNYTHYKNSSFDMQYEKIAFSTQLNESQNAALEADSLLMSAAPIVVLYYDASIRLIQNNVHRLSNDAINRLLLKRVSKTADKRK